MDHLEVQEMRSTIRIFVHVLAKFIFLEDLKTEGSDEFDYMICLEDLSNLVCKIKEIDVGFFRRVHDPWYLNGQVISRDHLHR